MFLCPANVAFIYENPTDYPKKITIRQNILNMYSESSKLFSIIHIFKDGSGLSNQKNFIFHLPLR